MSLLDSRLESVASDLEPLGFRVMFFGAGVLHRYLDGGGSTDLLRPTEDVDALLQVCADGSALKATRSVESQLADRGWRHDTRSHRRNVHAYISPGGIPVDIVIDALYPRDDWPVVAQGTAEERVLPAGHVIRVPSPALFLICKLEASKNPARWEGAYQSHDLEDVAQLIAGCGRLEGSVERADARSRGWLREWAQGLSAGSTFGTQSYACLEGNWPREVDLARLDEFLEFLGSGA